MNKILNLKIKGKKLQVSIVNNLYMHDARAEGDPDKILTYYPLIINGDNNNTRYYYAIKYNNTYIMCISYGKSAKHFEIFDKLPGASTLDNDIYDIDDDINSSIILNNNGNTTNILAESDKQKELKDGSKICKLLINDIEHEYYSVMYNSLYIICTSCKDGICFEQLTQKPSIEDKYIYKVYSY